MMKLQKRDIRTRMSPKNNVQMIFVIITTLIIHRRSRNNQCYSTLLTYLPFLTHTPLLLNSKPILHWQICLPPWEAQSPLSHASVCSHWADSKMKNSTWSYQVCFRSMQRQRENHWKLDKIKCTCLSNKCDNNSQEQGVAEGSPKMCDQIVAKRKKILWVVFWIGIKMQLERN